MTWDFEELIDAAGLLHDYCDHTPCESCIFNLKYGYTTDRCMFNSEPTTGFVPWEWDIPERRQVK